jgi:hypothetical protein
MSCMFINHWPFSAFQFERDNGGSCLTWKFVGYPPLHSRSDTCNSFSDLYLLYFSINFVYDVVSSSQSWCSLSNKFHGLTYNPQLTFLPCCWSTCTPQPISNIDVSGWTPKFIILGEDHKDEHPVRTQSFRYSTIIHLLQDLRWKHW